MQFGPRHFPSAGLHAARFDDDGVRRQRKRRRFRKVKQPERGPEQQERNIFFRALLRKAAQALRRAQNRSAARSPESAQEKIRHIRKGRRRALLGVAGKAQGKQERPGSENAGKIRGERPLVHRDVPYVMPAAQAAAGSAAFEDFFGFFRGKGGDRRLLECRHRQKYGEPGGGKEGRFP